MRAALVASAIVLSAGAACAPQPVPDAAAPAAAGERQCFNARDLNGFQLVNARAAGDRVRDRAVDLTVGANRVYRAELYGTCPDLRSAVGIGVRTRSGSDFVCEGVDIELIVPSEVGPQYCAARSLRMLTAAEIEAERAARRR